MAKITSPKIGLAAQVDEERGGVSLKIPHSDSSLSSRN